MGQPVITGTPPILRFGTQALPDGQGNMPNLNLNDLVSWFWNDFRADHDYLLHGLGHVVYGASGVYLSFDAKNRTLSLPVMYSEAVNPLGAALAVMSMAGEQMLTTDNATGILARFNAARGRSLRRRFPPFYWDLTLEFLCRTPYFQDLTTTTVAPTAVGGAVSPGTTTNINVTYAGSVWCAPVWTFTVPVGNGVVINSLVLSNQMKGEALTVNFPGGLLASTAYSFVIDSGARTVTNGSTQYDFNGSFPNLYPSGQVAVSQVQQIRTVIVTATGTTTGCTLGATYTARYDI